jgi:hypothetical protein
MSIDEVGNEATRLLLDGESHRLREQYHAADTRVERSGAGFFVHFDVPDDIERIDTGERTVIHGVHATMDCLQYGMGFVLFVDDGLLSMVEGYTYEEEFPADIQTLRGVNVEYSGDDGVERRTLG